jgi:hypothetical protein
MKCETFFDYLSQVLASEKGLSAMAFIIPISKEFSRYQAGFSNYLSEEISARGNCGVSGVEKVTCLRIWSKAYRSCPDLTAV